MDSPLGLYYYCFVLVIYVNRTKDGRAFKNKMITYENRIAKYVITETKETSSGVYCCEATNDAGFAETSCTLTIQGIHIEYNSTTNS